MRRATGAAVVMAMLAVPAAGQAATTGERLQSVLDEVVAEHRLVPGAMAYVDAPRSGLPWAGAAGRVSLHGAKRLTPEDPFRIASVQKPFTAAAILRLVEQGRLDLDQRVAPFLDADQVARMHVLGGVSHGERITIRQLLRHTSGLNSHDSCTDYGVMTGSGLEREWTPREQVEFMIDCGDPVFAPDAPGRWSYSDTGFVMLGSVLASVTGKSYAGALRELLPLEALGLRHTWHELLEPQRALARPRVHQYYGPVDTTGWHPSFDSWGGGGYVSTVEELARFARVLLEGRVFERRSTLDLMLARTPIPPGAPASGGATANGLGLRFIEHEGVECVGHTGAWSVIMLYCPSLDLSFAATTSQYMDEHLERTEGYVARGIIDVVRSAHAAQPALRVQPRRAPARRRSRFALTFTAGGRPVSDAVVRLGNRRARTDAAGVARLAVRVGRIGLHTARACKAGVGCASATLRARRLGRAP